MGNTLSRTSHEFKNAYTIFILCFHPKFAAAWNDHYDKEDDAWVMKIFFPIIAALILLCLGSCGYANYCKQPSETNEDEEVDRQEEVYSLSKPDRPYLTPHYQRRTFQPPPPAYDNHAFRPPQNQAPSLGPKAVSATSAYQRHNPMGANNGFGHNNNYMPTPGSYGQFQPQFNNNQAIKPNPQRAYSFQVPQQHDAYERSKSLWEMPQQQTFKEPKMNYQTGGRASPIQSTRSAPAGMNALRRTFSSPNLTPSGSNGSFNHVGLGGYNQQYDNYQNQFGQNQFSNSTRHSVNYGRPNPYQRTPSPASSSSTYIPATSEVGSTAPLFSRRRSPNNGYNMFDTQSGFGGASSSNAGRGYQEFGNNHGRSYEMEDIYGRGGLRPDFHQYGSNSQQNHYNLSSNNQFQNQFQNNQFQHPNYPQHNQFQDSTQFSQNNSVYEHLRPQYPPDPYSNNGSGGAVNMAYDPYDQNHQGY